MNYTDGEDKGYVGFLFEMKSLRAAQVHLGE